METDGQLIIIKRRLGITDDVQDELLRSFLEDAEAHFLLLTGAKEVADKYLFIIRDVAIVRYNRKGSEGLSSESVDGYSASYSTADFNPYMDILSRDFDLSATANKGIKIL